ncbi:hypothetical protein D3C73_1252250 [compost metagenome]
MLQFTRCVQWVHVYHNHAGTQNAKQRHRILQQVRHHQCDTIALFQPQPFLQICRKCAATLFEFAEGHYLPHIHKRGLIGIAPD